jgi:hypothetical protein
MARCFHSPKDLSHSLTMLSCFLGTNPRHVSLPSWLRKGRVSHLQRAMYTRCSGTGRCHGGSLLKFGAIVARCPDHVALSGFHALAWQHGTAADDKVFQSGEEVTLSTQNRDRHTQTTNICDSRVVV